LAVTDRDRESETGWTVHYSDKRCSDTRYSDKRWYFNN